MAVDKKGGSGTTAYTATLARNACHFAPESWHSWEDHHHKALLYAKKAHQVGENQQDFKLKARYVNEALLYNGFGAQHWYLKWAAVLFVGAVIIIGLIYYFTVQVKKSAEPVALMWPLGANSKKVCVSVPRRTRTAQQEPRWSWMGERWPFFQHRTQA